MLSPAKEEELAALTGRRATIECWCVWRLHPSTSRGRFPRATPRVAPLFAGMSGRTLLAILVLCAAAGVRCSPGKLGGSDGSAAAAPAVLLPAAAPGEQAPVAIPAHLKPITPEIAGKACT